MRALVTVFLAFLLGALASAVALELGWIALQPGRTVATVIRDVPEVSMAEVEIQRNTQFASIRSIEDLLALPGRFAQTEALYVLAGRADSAGVQDLIFQASGIHDPADRQRMLRVLFSRLAELDAPSALALARTGAFAADRELESAVWQSWGRLDLDNALRAAATVDSASQRELAGQALLVAYGHWGNDTTARIADGLGIEPDEATRAAYLVRLAAEDPDAALDSVNSLRRSEQHEAATVLGQHLGRSGMGAAMRYATRLDGKSLQRAYTAAAAKASARLDPGAALDVLLADDLPGRTEEFHAAIHELVQQDVEGALAYFNGIESPRLRNRLASAIGPALAREDPERGLAWARENDSSLHMMPYATVLATVAAEDPELAIREAQRLPGRMRRQSAFSMLAMTLSQDDPEQTVKLLDQIEHQEDRANVARTVASTWIQADPDAALAWILEREAPERDEMLAMAGQMLPQISLDTAMRWLPRVDERTASAWRGQIASGLAMQRSAAEAERFIAGFEGSAQYPQLQAAAITGIARNDIDSAFAMAGEMPAGRDRDALYSNLVMQYAQEDPRQAAGLLVSIDDDVIRAQSTGAVVQQWSRTDPAAAQQWVQSLPRGDARDDAILQLSTGWDEMTPARRLLLDSIGSADKRKQALIGHAFQVARSDRKAAQRIISDLGLSEHERQQLLQQIDNFHDHQLRMNYYLQ